MMTQVQQLFDALKLVPQSQVHHPEGDVFTHTALVMREVLRRTRGDEPVITVAAVWHDVGKLQTTVVNGDKISAHDHELVSCDLFDQFAPLCHPHFTARMLVASRFIIRNHMRAKRLDSMRPSRLQRFKNECAEMDRIFPFNQVSMFFTMKMFAECDSMTSEPGVLAPIHAHALKDGAVKNLERLLLSMRRHEIRETTRIKVRKEMEEQQ